MSRVMILLAHPIRGSFNHAIAETAAVALEGGGHEVFYHDLYEEGFDPILPGKEIPRHAGLPAEIARHCR